MPKGFRFPFDEVELWAPHHSWPLYRDELAKARLALRTNGMVGPIAPHAAGCAHRGSARRARGDRARMAAQYPEGGEKRGLARDTLRDEIVSDVRQAVLVLLGAVGFVLLIACGQRRQPDAGPRRRRAGTSSPRAPRSAPGRGRLASELLTEAGLLWLGGRRPRPAAGWAGLRALMASAPARPARRDRPAARRHGRRVHARRHGPHRRSRSASSPRCASRRPTRPRRSAAAAARASTAGAARGCARRSWSARWRSRWCCSSGAGLLTRSFGRLAKVDVGFRSEGLLTMEYRLPAEQVPGGAAAVADAPPDHRARARRARRRLRRTRARPAVQRQRRLRAESRSSARPDAREAAPRAPNTATRPTSRRWASRCCAAASSAIGTPRSAPPVVVVSQQARRAPLARRGPGREARSASPRREPAAPYRGDHRRRRRHQAVRPRRNRRSASSTRPRPRIPTSSTRSPCARRATRCSSRTRCARRSGPSIPSSRCGRCAPSSRSSSSSKGMPRFLAAAHGQLCRAGAGARGGGPLRRDVVCGDAAHARDRAAHGARRRARGRAADRLAPRLRARGRSGSRSGSSERSLSGA